MNNLEKYGLEHSRFESRRLERNSCVFVCIYRNLREPTFNFVNKEDGFGVA